MTVALLATLGLGAGCGDDPVAPEDELVLLETSAHFEYRGVPGDQPVDTAYQERHLAWAVERLGVEPTRRFVYHKYRDAAHLERVTGHDRGTGFAEGGTYRFHTVSPIDNHEYLHSLYTSEVGTSPPLFNEGVVVAHHGASYVGSFDGPPLWNGESAHAFVRRLRARGELPSLDAVGAASGFYDLDGLVTYGVAGSFVRYLLDEAGVETFHRFVRLTGGPGDGLAATRANFQAAYGESLDTWWGRWLDALDEL